MKITVRQLEFAITIRREAMGKGYSKYGMAMIIEIAFADVGLEKVYWCVSEDNLRAIRFYEKNGYQRVSKVPRSLLDNYKQEQLMNFIWFLAENK